MAWALITLFLTLLYQIRCAYLIQDLNETTSAFVTQAAVGWNLSNKLSSGANGRGCGSFYLLGGPYNAGYNSRALKTFSNLPPHNAIYFEIKVFIIDSWMYERLKFNFDSLSLTTWGFPANIYQQFRCGSLSTDCIVTLRGFVFHNKNSLDFEVNSTLTNTNPTAYWGIRDVNFVFLNYTEPNLPFEMCGNTTDNIPSSSRCKCGINQYNDSVGVCQPCPAPCSRCYGEFYQNCLLEDKLPANTYYGNCLPKCKKCHSDLACLECEPGYCGPTCSICPPTSCTQDQDCTTPGVPYCNPKDNFCAPIRVQFVNLPKKISPEVENNISIKIDSFDNQLRIAWTLNPPVQYKNTTSGIIILPFTQEITTISIEVLAINSNAYSTAVGISLSVASKEIPSKTMPSVIIDTVTEGTRVVSIGLVSVAGSSMIFGADPTLAWGIINLMQMLYYLLFFNIEYPSNMRRFLEIFSIGRLTFLPNPLELPFSGLEEQTLPSPKKFFENDFSGFFIQSAGSMIFMIIVSLVMVLVTNLSLLIQKKSKWLLAIKNFYVWSGLFRTWTVTYFELTIASILQLFVLNFTDFKLSLSSILGIIVFCLNLSFPLLVYKILKSIKLERQYLSKYNSLIEDFDINKPFQKFFMIVILVRKFLHALFMVALYEIPVLQVLSVWMLNLMTLFLYIVYRPHSRQINNFAFISVELAFFGIHSLILVITLDLQDSNLSEYQRDLIGWLMISFCLLLISKEMITLLIEQYHTFRSLFRKGFRSERQEKKKYVTNKTPTKSSLKVKQDNVFHHKPLIATKPSRIYNQRMGNPKKVSFKK